MPTDARAALHGVLDEALEELRTAIDQERHDWRNRRHLERIDIGPGERLLPTGTYRFEKARRKVLPYPPGAVVDVVFEAPPAVLGTVVAQTRTTIDLELSDYGSTTPPASIIWDPAWLLRELAGTVAALAPSPVTLAGLGLLRPGPRTYRPLILPHDHLDPEQYAALHSVVSERFALLEGPPGSGKSRVLTALVREMRARGHTVLVAAPSHAAADVVTERILDLIQDGGAPELGWVVRWGTPQTSRLRRYAEQENGLGFPSGLWVHDGSDADADRVALARAQVLIATTARCYINGGMLRGFDHVILDEGGMCPIPVALAVAKHALCGVTVAGDPQQLGPIIHSRSLLADRWLRRTVFDLSDASGAIAHVRLTRQYRMAPRVAALVGRLSYGGQLTSAPGVLDRPVPFSGVGREELILVDTSGHKTGRGRLEDLYHARVVGHMADLIGCGDGGGTVEILALARYRAQVRRIAHALRGQGHAEPSTVHAAQGSEARTVIFDLIPGGPDWLGDYLTDSHPRSDGSRIITVAASRAIYRLVVVADVTWLMGRLPRDAVARRLLNLLLADAKVMQSESLLGLRPPRL